MTHFALKSKTKKTHHNDEFISHTAALNGFFVCTLETVVPKGNVNVPPEWALPRPPPFPPALTTSAAEGEEEAIPSNDPTKSESERSRSA